MSNVMQALWLAVLLGLIEIIPRLFNSTVEKANAYFMRRNKRLTEKGKDSILTFYILLYMAYLYAYMVKFL